MRAVKREGVLRGTVRRFGPVTAGLLVVNVAVFLVTAVAAGVEGATPLANYRSSVFLALAQVPVLVDLGEVWRLVTAAFLHIGPLHLALNMMALLIFGAELERQLGHWRYASLYAVSLLGGSAAIQLFGGPGGATAGASGALFGVLGALAVLIVIRKQDVRGILTLLAINIVVSFLPGISLLGHLGGLVAGAAAAGVIVAFRRRPPLQAAGLAVLGVGLLLVALTVPTVGVGGL